jgi:hypothetical protein
MTDTAWSTEDMPAFNHKTVDFDAVKPGGDDLRPVRGLFAVALISAILWALLAMVTS